VTGRAEPHPVGELAAAVVRGLGAEPGLDRLAADVWAELAGAPLAHHVRVAGVRDGTVHLVADGGVWASRARYRGAELARRLGGRDGRRLGVRVTVTRHRTASGRGRAARSGHPPAGEGGW
jgi:predicted nucleic acid-binding Zn ribbon protein